MSYLILGEKQILQSRGGQFLKSCPLYKFMRLWYIKHWLFGAKEED